MPKDVHHQQERVKLGGESKYKIEASPSQSNKLGAAGKMFVMSKSRKQMWERMKKKVASVPPLAQSVHVD